MSKNEEKAKKLASLGWSQAKIERSLSQSTQSRQRSAKRAEQASRADAERWSKFIADIHAAGSPYIGLLLHFYDGALTQNIQLKSRVRVPAGARALEALPRLEEDTLYEFRAEA